MSSTESSKAPTPSGSGEPASSDAAGKSGGKPGDTARRLLRTVDRASLATAQRDASGWPYPSLVQVALDLNGTPLLLLSTLADHTKNIADDPRVGLLFDGTAGMAQPLAGARVSVLGRAERSDDPRHRARFLARHPGASFYAGFGDFGIYKVSVDRAHLVAGFGRVHWVDSAEFLLSKVPLALAEAEPDILAHMNTDHTDAIRLYATALLGLPDQDGPDQHAWTMTGIDPEGCDLRRGAAIARVDFDQRVEDPASARAVLAGLARRAREKGAGGGDVGPTGAPYT
ncbi:HugZ family protein [Azospirillum soli]|uniref:HugZ family pyridoxamine 5'-phosphate oxidase n=1 Tax=Azospirillum soli TaxID=1304799 RepID=UPI001AE96E04|nr:DUF2470 domain-containing protein [Azospirillum soli]MBP2316221.1 putative heme iron utilization protein [Azospirillum soli]